MIPPVCYSAALPLFVYGVLLGLNVIDRTDGNVAALMLAEGVAVVFTVRGTIARYRRKPKP